MVRTDLQERKFCIAPVNERCCTYRGERLSGAVLYRVREGCTGREKDLQYMGAVQAQRNMFRNAIQDDRSMFRRAVQA